MTPFHLAFVVDDLEAARRFYGEILGCPIGRSSETWVDFNLGGHQIVAHLDTRGSRPGVKNPVDGKSVPVPHFGLVLEWDAFEHLAARVRAAGVHFELEPGVRFEGQVGEQATMFFADPAGNALEFKAFRDPEQLFAS